MCTFSAHVDARRVRAGHCRLGLLPGDVRAQSGGLHASSCAFSPLPPFWSTGRLGRDRVAGRSRHESRVYAFSVKSPLKLVAFFKFPTLSTGKSFRQCFFSSSTNQVGRPSSLLVYLKWTLNKQKMNTLIKKCIPIPGPVIELASRFFRVNHQLAHSKPERNKSKSNYILKC